MFCFFCEDVSVKASARWAAGCHGFAFRQVVEKRCISLYSQHDVLNSISLRTIATIIREITHTQRQGQPLPWYCAELMQADAETSISQLESCGAFLDGHCYSRRRSGELMLRVLQLAADARSTYRVKSILMNALACTFYQVVETDRLALYKLVHEDLQLPSQSTIVQWRLKKHRQQKQQEAKTKKQENWM